MKNIYLVPLILSIFSLAVIAIALQLDTSPEMIVGDSMQARSFPIFLMILKLILIGILTFQFYKNNPKLMNNLRGVALEEKVMKFIVNSCEKKEKHCTIDELFKSDFLQNEKKMISNKKKEKK